ncbi:MAG: ABC transporter permease subunit [Isosphaeraceae bacterium]|nr:ABC transporter permease subunit [Isosphaeraceae bacterium]
MPIFDQGYQHWDGRLSGHAFRWLAITRQGVNTMARLKAVRWVIILAWGPALLLTVFLSIWGLIEQKSELLTPFLNILQALPEEIRDGPKAYRKTIWTIAYYNFYALEIYFALLITAIVGPNLISQDLRFNAIPLYFSKPLRRIDYFIGKLGVVATFIGAVTILPAVLAYVMGVSFSLEWSVITDTWPILVGAIGHGLIVCISSGTLILAISSLSKNSRYVAALWVGFWLVSGAASGILLQTVREPWCELIAYQRNIDNVRNAMLDTQGAREKIVALVESSEKKMREAMNSAGPFGGFGPFGGRRRPMPPPRPRRFDVDPGDDPSIVANRRIPFTPDREKAPWIWSAGVLFGLFGASAWVLTTRVKSLDRLR